jgi:histidyl-tRNA synthetase
VSLAQRFGFQRLDIPVVEDTNLFARGVGTASDFFVNKEMYTIVEDEKTGDSITLRPEFTAGIVRAYIQNGLHNWPQPVKLFTFGPIFRRERPQAGRFRQHSQFDVEILGETDPAADLEVMMLAMSLYRELGYSDLTFQLNSTGCPTCKPKYIDLLVAYLGDNVEKLAPVDQERLKLNPLRILDSKEQGMDALLADAPHIVDHLCEDCASHFADLRHLLDALEQSYTINFRLVRGIDYYTKTVFEVWDQRIGAQAALCGGGRYDGLAEAIGGASTPGVGFGLGIERVVLGLKAEGVEAPAVPEPRIFITHFGGETKTTAVSLSYRLRTAGLGSRLAFARGKRSLKSQMREANKYPIAYTLIVGESEVENKTVAVRDMGTGEQTIVPQADLVDWFRSRGL